MEYRTPNPVTSPHRKKETGLILSLLFLAIFHATPFSRFSEGRKGYI